MSSRETVEIAPDVHMPLLGFGTWQLRGRSARNAVADALELGYRHIDTAQMYGNEAEVGRALADSNLERSEVFVTTKLWPDRAGRERETLAESLDALGLDAVDLWLIHWPVRGGAAPHVWEKFVEAERDGLTRAIGVSNYDVGQLDELHQATGRMPAVNQIEWGPALYDAGLVAAHRERGVQLEGYSPLKTTNLLDERLQRIAAAHRVTPAQVVIRWHLEHGFVVIPKSSHRERIAENADVHGFKLDADEVAELDALRAGARRD